jgi:hypothetical protein
MIIHFFLFFLFFFLFFFPSYFLFLCRSLHSLSKRPPLSFCSSLSLLTRVQALVRRAGEAAQRRERQATVDQAAQGSSGV